MFQLHTRGSMPKKRKSGDTSESGSMKTEKKAGALKLSWLGIPSLTRRESLQLRASAITRIQGLAKSAVRRTGSIRLMDPAGILKQALHATKVRKSMSSVMRRHERSLSLLAMYERLSGLQFTQGLAGYLPNPIPEKPTSTMFEYSSTIPHSQPQPGDWCDSGYCKARKVCPAYKNPKWKPAPFSLTQITSKPKPKEQQMSRLANIVKGKFEAPLWDVITGPEGVGKSSFAAGYPSPVWLSLDRGTSHLNIQRMPDPKTWTDILESVSELTTEKHDFRTVVIDPVNFAEALCWDFVCKRDSKPSIEDYGYGKGYQVALVEWRNLVKKLDGLRSEKGMNIVLVAHTAVKRQKSPDAEDFERYALAMHETAAALFRQQADHVLFARIPVTTEKVSPGRFKGRSSNQRELRTTWSPAWDAKSRPALPDPLPLNYAAYEAARKDAGSKLDALKATLTTLLEGFDAETQAKARSYLLEDPDSISRYELTIEALNEKQKEAV